MYLEHFIDRIRFKICLNAFVGVVPFPTAVSCGVVLQNYSSYSLYRFGLTLTTFLIWPYFYSSKGKRTFVLKIKNKKIITINFNTFTICELEILSTHIHIFLLVLPTLIIRKVRIENFYSIIFLNYGYIRKI